MTRVTILLTLAGLAVLFVAYAQGVHVIHGGSVITHMYWATGAISSVITHMYWATGAISLVALANFIAVAHLARSERMIRELRALCEKNGIDYGED